MCIWGGGDRPAGFSLQGRHAPLTVHCKAANTMQAVAQFLQGQPVDRADVVQGVVNELQAGKASILELVRD